MAIRAYGQFCGFARALEVIGERWALLIVRDLLIGPKRFVELQRGLPGIPSNILSARLKELEEGGIVTRRVQARPAAGIAYELTEEGHGLEESVVALGRWGARSLREPRSEEIVTDDSIAMALRTIFRPEAADGSEIDFELHVGKVVSNARVRGDRVTVGRGSLPAPDLLIEAGTSVRELLAGEITPKEALKSGSIRITGKRALLDRFVQLFRI